MKVLTLSPPFFARFSRTSRSPGVSKGGCVYYPIWLGYATGVLEQAGFDVKLIDAPSDSLSHEDVYDKAVDFQPNLIVMDTVTASFTNDVKVAEGLKQRLPDAQIVFVGDHTTALPEECLKASKAFDIVTRNEYDYTVLEIAQQMRKGKLDLSTIFGISYRQTNGEEKILHNPERPWATAEQLDAQPFVSETYKKHLTIEHYFYPSVLFPEVTIITGRGCKFRCTFCLDADTVIAVKENGRVKVDTISKLLDAHLEKEGKNVQGYDLLNTQEKNILIWSNGEFVSVKNISKIKESKRLQIRLSNGTAIELTADHIVPVMRNGNMLELRAGEINKGDKLKFSNPLPETEPVKRIDVYQGLIDSASEDDLKDVYIHGVDNYFEFLRQTNAQEFEAEYKAIKINWKYSNILPIKEFNRLKEMFGLPEAVAEKLEIGGKNILPLPFYLPITHELMTLIGFFVSEGNYNNFNLAIAKSDSETRNEIIRCIRSTFPKTYVTETKGSDERGAQVYFGGKLAFLLFRKILDIPAGSANKKLPWIVFNASIEHQNTCLKALFSGDGTWDKARKIKYYTSSKTLANQLMVLLAKKGINYNLEMQDNRGPAFIHRPVRINNPIHRITIGNWDDRQKFTEEIGFFGSRQQDILNYQASHKPNRVAVLEKLQENPLSAKELAKELDWSHANARQILSKLVAREAIEKVEIKTSGFIKQMQYKAAIQSYKNTIPEFLEVASVEEVTREGYVYDVETENNYFTANNIVVHNCKWPQTITGHAYRERSIKNVADEFEWIEKNLPQVKDIMIEDDTLTQDKQRTMELCNEIINRGLKIKWTCNARADVPLDVIQKMKEANCRLMCVGFESADQGILNNIKKGTVTQVIRQFMQDTKKANMLVHGCFMLGNKGETPETIKKTIDFAKELDPDTAQFFPLMVYPGTEAYQWAKENGYLTTTNFNEWLLRDGTHNTIVSTEHLTAHELVRWCDKARLEFYIRPKFIMRKLAQVTANPLQEGPRFLISTAVFSRHIFKELKEFIAPSKEYVKPAPVAYSAGSGKSCAT